jgi:hypothetical protein
VTDHHDEDTTTVPDTTVTTPHPRVRRDVTRLDPYGMYDVAEPTRVTPAPPVSPIGAHTRGAAATTPPIPPAVSTLNALLDDRDRIAADTRAAWTGRPLFRTDRRKVRTVREAAARRAEARLRHERTLEWLETARSATVLAILVGLLLLVVGAGVVGFGILDGWFAWKPSR